jgi:hypothetical protein
MGPFILRQNFDGLYSLVTRSLEQALGERTYFDSALPLPGFHMWIAPLRRMPQSGQGAMNNCFI